jgi:tetratricopeptide (TPR) repeat protein
MNRKCSTSSSGWLGGIIPKGREVVARIRSSEVLCITSRCVGVLFLGGALLASQPDATVSSTVQALRTRDYQLALKLALELTQSQPSNPQSWALQGIALSHLGEKDGAMIAFRHALRLQPNCLAALEGAGQLAFQSGDRSAKEFLERVVALRPNDQTAHAMLGVIEYTNENCHSAVSHFRYGRGVIASNPAVLTDYGACLMRLQQPEDAVLVFHQVLDLQPQGLYSRYNLAVAQFETHHNRDVIATLQPLVNGPQPSVDALNLIAAAYEADYQTSSAVAALRRAINLAPRDTRNYLDLAAISLNHRSFQVGVDVLQAALDELPDSPELYTMRGILYVQLLQYSKAIDDFERAEKLGPTQDLSVIAKGIALLQSNRVDQSLESVRNRLKETPDDPMLNYLLSEILIRRGIHAGTPDFQEAHQAAIEATRLKPDFAPAHDNLAKLDLISGNLEAAEKESRKALAADPNDRTAVYHLIVALRRCGHTEEIPDLTRRLAEIDKAEKREAELRYRYRLFEVPAGQSPSMVPASGREDAVNGNAQ